MFKFRAKISLLDNLQDFSYSSFIIFIAILTAFSTCYDSHAPEKTKSKKTIKHLKAFQCFKNIEELFSVSKTLKKLKSFILKLQMSGLLHFR